MSDSPSQASELHPDLLTAAYDYTLPSERIAQTPVEPRDQARMLVVRRSRHEHRRFCDLPHSLRPGDLLVLNDTKVIPARLFGTRLPRDRDPQAGIPAATPKVEVLLLEPIQTGIPECIWRVLVKPGKRVKVGDRIQFWDPQGSTMPYRLEATIQALDASTGGRILQFEWAGAAVFETVLEQVGQIPFPPYIQSNQARPQDYQTVWARQPGSVAAPTAGLHFTQELLDRLAQAGIPTAYITLNIGLGTFRPVEVERVTEHQLHSEWLKVPAETVEAIQATQARGGRIIAVGTTVARSLETAAKTGSLQPWQGNSDLFIYPGYTWRVVQGLITNFHLPRSSLMMLVAALIGRQRLLDLYQEALEQEYRFYSFGDGMLILPQADE
ncbi:tRNA preQ1(34) S-adenosylmethionine ribosyltransferase-isomerase QueA [Synechococcus sp. Nb3U1]|uniref:tRNA preQ1(34) S-adenosylmethionine ribosyltransferase-isomerase QueA n=1 Tax=Synechococcus sp. Nb3U1 TaxID=1914529 RepID=UPI001F02F341|nr:tRNA preQ1(34) S-adenosylmethionine ribosyltransferase-isomerase QueA [Synechococcus sp. Nb3U1]MCF2970998.1 tRNA preQ1(34) S-adenosylmethionine ribosyltransferase-isomerase QueA [Synechococcus sp. Nb3U1]